MKKFLTITCAALACTSLALGLTGCIDKDDGTKSLETMNPVYEKYEGIKYFTKATTVDSLKGYQAEGKKYGDWVDLRKYEDSECVGIALLNPNTDKIISMDDKDTDTVQNEWRIYEFSSVVNTSNFNYQIHDYQKREECKNKFDKVARSIVVVTHTYTDLEEVSKSYVETVFYNGKGDAIATMDGEFQGIISMNVVVDGADVLFFFDLQDDGSETCYFNEEGQTVSYDPKAGFYSGSLLSNAGENVNVKKVKGENGGYLVQDGKNNRFVSYGEDLNVKYTLDLPTYANVTATILFDSGNYIIQYIVSQPDDAKEYDVLQGSIKCSLTTLSVDVDAGTKKELECALVLSDEDLMTPASMEEANEAWNVTEGIAAYVKGIGEIDEDKRVDYNNSRTWFGIMEDGTVKKAAPVVADMEVSSVRELVNGNFLVAEVTGRMYVVSKDGAILTEINVEAMQNAMIMANANSEYYLLDKTFYDANFQEVYTLKENYEIVASMNGEIVLKETVKAADKPDEYKWYFFNDGQLKQIASSADNQNVQFLHGNSGTVGCAVVKVALVGGEPTYTFTYYNADGVKIDVSENIQITDVVASSEEGDVIYVSYETIEGTGVEAKVVYGIMKLN